MNRMSIAIALLVAAPLAAQQPDSTKPVMPMHRHGEMGMDPMMGQMMMGMMEMMGPMMRTMAFEPDHLLARKDALELTPQQVTRLTALRDAAKAAHDAAHAGMQTHMAALAQAMKANAPDTAALKQHFQEAHSAMGRAHWAMLSAAAQARAILTDAQRGRVDGWADMMQMRMGEEHGEMPEHEEHQRDRN
jgi:Spy/CpxP family protein refolding chaperone